MSTDNLTPDEQPIDELASYRRLLAAAGSRIAELEKERDGLKFAMEVADRVRARERAAAETFGLPEPKTYPSMPPVQAPKQTRDVSQLNDDRATDAIDKGKAVEAQREMFESCPDWVDWVKPELQFLSGDQLRGLFDERDRYKERSSALEQALKQLHSVVIRQNQIGAEWHTDLFDDLMAALAISSRLISADQQELEAYRRAATEMEKTPLSIRPPDDYFRVEVSDFDGQIVAIERGMIAGRAITPIFEWKIREAVANLCCFIGDRAPSETLHSDETDFDSKKVNTVLQFGNGRVVINTGTHLGKPAVFIAIVDIPGIVGASAKHLNHPKHELLPGEIVFMFHSEDQAIRVADALVGSIFKDKDNKLAATETNESQFLHDVIRDMRVENRLHGHITDAVSRYLHRYPEHARDVVDHPELTPLDPEGKSLGKSEVQK